MSPHPVIQHPTRNPKNGIQKRNKRKNKRAQTELLNDCQTTTNGQNSSIAKTKKIPALMDMQVTKPDSYALPDVKKRKQKNWAANQTNISRVKPIENLNTVTICNYDGYLTKQEADYLIQYLGYLIEMESYQVGYAYRPLFKDRPFYKNSLLHIRCENAHTVDWLCVVIHCINLREGYMFVVNRKSTNMVRCGTLVNDRIDVQSIKMVLSYQNLWAETHRWVFHTEEIRKSKTLLIVSIPEDILEKIRNNNNKLFYKLATADVLEKGPKGAFLSRSQIEKMATENGAKMNTSVISGFYEDDVEMGDVA